MSSVLRILAKLIPFGSPGTPLAQDLLYTAAIAACAVVFFYERYQRQTLTPDRHDRERDDQTEGLLNSEEDHADALDDDTERIDEVENDARDADFDGAGNDIPHEPFRPHEQVDDNAGEGPAGPPNLLPDRPLPAQRNVGAKKAKSLAKKDQRRAYHEFMGNQGRAQRAQEAEGAAEREAVIAAERAKRAAAEAKIEAKKAREREAKRVAEAKERDWEARRRTEPVELVKRELERNRMCNLWKVVEVLDELDLDYEFVEKLLRLAGVLGKSATADGSVVMLTGKGWVVKIEPEDMKAVYKLAAENVAHGEGENIAYDDLAGILQARLTNRT